MILDEITCVILTFNEEPNIARLLERLHWAKRVVVFDSGSTDRTTDLVASFANAELRSRPFESHASQWNAALELVDTEWVLTLDADHFPSRDFESELLALQPPDEVVAYTSRFAYAIYGKPLRGTLLPSIPILFRRGRASFVQDGHANKLRPVGKVGSLTSIITHDDRKSLERWTRSQISYMQLERRKLLTEKKLSFADQLRLSLIGPFIVFFYTLLVKGAILDGRAGLFYAYQRLLAETLLALELLDHRLRVSDEDGDQR